MDYFRRIFTFLSDLIFPAHCTGCSRVGQSLCPTCLKTILPRHDQECIVCTAPSVDGRPCRQCQPHTAVDRLLIGGHRSSTVLMGAIRTFKYRHSTDLAMPLGQWLAHGLSLERIAREAFHHDPLITGVPLHLRRLRERGYNQAELIARSVCTAIALPYADALIARTRHTHSQVEAASRQERLRNMHDMFVAAHPERVSGRDIIIIDDVCTTGATLHACAQALKGAGARTVTAVVLARS